MSENEILVTEQVTENVHCNKQDESMHITQTVPQSDQPTSSDWKSYT